LAWQALSAGADAFAACSDDVAKQGMRIYGNPAGHDPRIVSGESGAVTLGLLKAMVSGQASDEARRRLQLDGSAKVLLISTEGDTDPDFYRQVVWSCR
jgi:diaminopropionate ammonia-lyase